MTAQTKSYLTIIFFRIDTHSDDTIAERDDVPFTSSNKLDSNLKPTIRLNVHHANRKCGFSDETIRIRGCAQINISSSLCSYNGRVTRRQSS